MTAGSARWARPLAQRSRLIKPPATLQPCAPLAKLEISCCSAPQRIGQGTVGPMTRAWVWGILLACSLLQALPGHAQDKTPPDSTPPNKTQQETGDKIPVLLQADEITYDRDLGVVTARGHVEIARGDRVVHADTVS